MPSFSRLKASLFGAFMVLLMTPLGVYAQESAPVVTNVTTTITNYTTALVTIGVAMVVVTVVVRMFSKIRMA